MAGEKGIPREVVEQARAKGLLTPKEACDRLGITRKQLSARIRDEVIEPVVIDGIRFFDPNHLSEFDLDSEDLMPDRDYVLKWSLEALQAREDHINQLIRLSHEPAQETIKALLSENASLRQRAQEQEKTVAEVHELYGELLRQSLVAEVDAEKERAATRMKEDAFKMLQTQLLPVVLSNLTAKRFIESFTDDQITAFIEAGVGSEEQNQQLHAELARRQQLKERKGNTHGKAHDSNPLDGTKGSDSE